LRLLASLTSVLALTALASCGGSSDEDTVSRGLEAVHDCLVRSEYRVDERFPRDDGVTVLAVVGEGGARAVVGIAPDGESAAGLVPEVEQVIAFQRQHRDESPDEPVVAGRNGAAGWVRSPTDAERESLSRCING
jgi:hypothetical protein